jgi:hypothetical protein
MLRSLLVGLLVSTLPCAALADPPRGKARERPVTPSRSQRPEAQPAHARGPKPRAAHVAPGRPFGTPRVHPSRGHPRQRDRARTDAAPRECHEVSEPPQIALFLLGVGGLALLGRRSRRRSLPLEAQRQREIR